MAKQPTNDPAPQGADLIGVLKQAVRESGLSLSQIARESGLSQSQLSRFVNGNKTLSLDSASKLFTFLGLEVVATRRESAESATSENPLEQDELSRPESSEGASSAPVTPTPKKPKKLKK